MSYLLFTDASEMMGSSTSDSDWKSVVTVARGRVSAYWTPSVHFLLHTSEVFINSSDVLVQFFPPCVSSFLPQVSHTGHQEETASWMTILAIFQTFRNSHIFKHLSYVAVIYLFTLLFEHLLVLLNHIWEIYFFTLS